MSIRGDSRHFLGRPNQRYRRLHPVVAMRYEHAVRDRRSIPDRDADRASDHRFNRGKSGSRGPRFFRLMQQAVTTPPGWCLPEILQHVLDALRMFRDYGQQHTRRLIRPGPSLLPVAQGCRREPEFGGELRLTQPHQVAEPLAPSRPSIIRAPAPGSFFEDARTPRRQNLSFFRLYLLSHQRLTKNRPRIRPRWCYRSERSTTPGGKSNRIIRAKGPAIPPIPRGDRISAATEPSARTRGPTLSRCETC